MNVTYAQRCYDGSVDFGTAPWREARMRLQHSGFIVHGDLPSPDLTFWQRTRANVPTSGGYVFVDSIERRIFEWHSGVSVCEVSQQEIAPAPRSFFVKPGNTIPYIRRHSVRQFVIGATYVDRHFGHSVSREFDPPADDNVFLSIVDKFNSEANDDRGVRYRLKLDPWTTERFEMTSCGMQAMMAAVSARTDLSRDDALAWNAMASKLIHARQPDRQCA
jgi:hypothetical protein